MNIQVDPTSSNLASAMLNSKIRPRAVVGTALKFFIPVLRITSPDHLVRTSRESRTNKLERFITDATNETISVRITDRTLRSPQYSLVYGPSLAGPNYSLKKQSSVFVPGFLLLPRYPYLRWSMKRKKLTA